MSQGKRVGEVTHFFTDLSVAVITLDAAVSVGDMVHFLGAHTDFRQSIDSMQIDREAIETAEAGAEVAVRVKQRVRSGDSVYQLTDDPD